MRQQLFGVIILAAGESTRMGEAKPLLKLGDTTFLQKILACPFLKNDYVNTIVVLGHKVRKICETISLSAPWVFNKRYKEGKTTSIQCGLDFLPSSLDGVFVWPVDCPNISEDVFYKMVDCFENTETICIPSHAQKRGHPPLIGAAYFDEIKRLRREQSLRDLYVKYEEHIIHVEVDTPVVLENINSPLDYDKMLGRNVLEEEESL